MAEAPPIDLTPRVLVIGDFHVNLLIGSVPPNQATMVGNIPCLYQQHIGGAHLLFRILGKALTSAVRPPIAPPRPEPKVECCLTLFARDSDKPKPMYLTAASLEEHRPEIEHVLSKIVAVLRPTRTGQPHDKPTARVHEVLGEVAPSHGYDTLTFQTGPPPEPPDVLVIHDANRGFRDLDPAATVGLFAKAGTNSKPQFIVLQMRGPLPALRSDSTSAEKSKLWKYLSSSFLDRLIVVLKYSSLIQAGVNLNVAQSFERAAGEFLSSMRYFPLSSLIQARHLMVQFPQGVLHYDRRHLQVEMLNSPLQFPYDDREGFVPARNMLLVAAIVQGLTTFRGDDPFDSMRGAVQRAILWAYFHDEQGLGLWDSDISTAIAVHRWVEGLFKRAKQFEDVLQKELFSAPATPVSLAPFLNNPIPNMEWPFGRIDVPIEEPCHKHWSRLDGLAQEYQTLDRDSTSAMVGHCIVEKGLNAVIREWLERKFESNRAAGAPWGAYYLLSSPCPYLRLGGMMAADRSELDAYLGIYGLIRRYLRDRKWRQPLSLAVFGPPGSGKSFAVREIMKAANQSRGENVREFNIAQFLTVQDLSLVFHKAQDLAVGATVPLVLLDEFDSRYEGQEFG